jgi:phosphoglycolate phosphatase-like HAD superfamily hydrolase
VSYLILFDIDGTLVLTGGAGSRAMGRAFHEVYDVENAFDGIPMPGRTDQNIVADAFERAGLPVEDGRVHHFRESYYRHLAEALDEFHPEKKVMPGVRELLNALQPRANVFLALLTGNYSRSAQLKLEHFDLWRYFACGAFGEDAPDRNRLLPVAVARARERGAQLASPDRVIVVGDTPHDVACAAFSGATSVAVATGTADAPTLRECGADIVFEDLSDTDAFLKLLG